MAGYPLLGMNRALSVELFDRLVLDRAEQTHAHAELPADEDGGAQPEREQAIPSERAGPIDPDGYRNQLRDERPDGHVAEPFRKDLAAIEEDGEREHQVLDDEDAERADERHEAEVVEHHLDLRAVLRTEG